jgi:hypothetical protein
LNPDAATAAASHNRNASVAFDWRAGDIVRLGGV